MAKRRPGLSAEDLRVGCRLLAALPRFLRHPFTLEQARAMVRGRLARRGEGLLQRIVQAYAVRDGPYRRLLEHAGCTPADAGALIGREGVEGALRELLRAGVYLTGDEFKGRRPVTRGSLEFTVEAASLLRPGAVVHGLAESSGSRGSRTSVPLDLSFVNDHAVNTHLALEAYGGRDWSHAQYGVPGGTAVTNPLELARGGRPPVRWFTPVDPATPALSSRYRLGTHALRLGSLLSGVPLPRHTLAPLDDPIVIVRWIAAERARGRIPHIWTFASSAVLVCQAAVRAGIDIAGARFTAGGEPTTEACRRVIESTGAAVYPRMGATESDILAYACPHGEAADDMHFFDDRHALIQPGDLAAGAALPSKAMLLSSLLPSAPITLLNVCLGDRAELTRRSCGCGLEREGWTLHIHEVRSYEKLTAGGMTLLDVDLVRILEQVLPGRFGGGPTDYQLVETLDDGQARPQVQLLVSPSVGPLDASEIAEVFLAAIGGGASGERLMELQWRGGGLLRVTRETPRQTASGKILHVAVDRAASPLH